MTDRMCQKWFVKFLGTTDILATSLLGAVLRIGRRFPWPLPTGSQRQDIGDSQHTQNIQINTVMVKMKNVSYLTETIKWAFWPT